MPPELHTPTTKRVREESDDDNNSAESALLKTHKRLYMRCENWSPTCSIDSSPVRLEVSPASQPRHQSPTPLADMLRFSYDSWAPEAGSQHRHKEVPDFWEEYDAQQDVCMICDNQLTLATRTVCVPCGHATTCMDCGPKLLSQFGCACPVCQTKAEQIIKLQM